MRWMLGLLAVLISLAPLRAAEVEALDVTEQRGVYHFLLIFSVDAPVTSVGATLTDYPNLSKLNPTIVESRLLPAPREGVTRVRTRMRGCVLFLCKDIVCTQDMRERGAGRLSAVIVPRLSDMKSGHANWRFEPRGHTTRVNFTAFMAPDFWIPPLIGPFILKHWLQGQLIETADNLEKLASLHS